jgi:hypothetical protein
LARGTASHIDNSTAAARTDIVNSEDNAMTVVGADTSSAADAERTSATDIQVRMKYRSDKVMTA